LGTSHSDEASAPAVGFVDHTMLSASLAEVTNVLRLAIRTPSPSATAVPSAAQNWLRDPGSLNASVVRCVPAAIALRVSTGPCASITAVAE
jgi:hypothetical protein